MIRGPIALFAMPLAIAIALFAAIGCGDPSTSSGQADDDDASYDTEPVDDDDVPDDDTDDDADDDVDDDADDDDEPACDESLRPIVFVHGFLAAGDTWANHTMRFASNGHCLERMYAFDYNTLGLGLSDVANLDALIDSALAASGATQVDLAGHSRGGGVGVQYLSAPARAAKVAHYAHVAAGGWLSPPGGVPTMTISSAGDLIAGVGTIPGATNVELDNQDHMQTAASKESFEAMYTFFHDGDEPATTDIVPQDEPAAWGRVVTLGENIPGALTPISVWPVDPATGLRLTDDPVAEFTTDDLGYWGPFDAQPDTYYEFFVEPVGVDQYPIHYYREPFARSNDLVYLRIFPDPDSLAGQILGQIEFADDRAVFITFTPNQATVAGRDTLFVDGYELSTEEITPAERTAIAIFYFDANDNGETDAEPAGGLFSGFPFLAGFDLFVDTETDRAIEMEFNGRTMAVRNWPSASDGASIAVFE
ncbi:MAG: alpha/beta fold hydrolase [Deltaproteobacteria bacterium]|nr:alpha/beta fold hydrolase [Deltaproteobacteria bacterium]